MRPDDVESEIVKAVQVTRANVVAAKAYLLGLTTAQRHESIAHAKLFAQLAAPGALKPLPLESEDISAQVARVAAHISARLAFGVAARELIRSDIFFQLGGGDSETIGWEWSLRGGGGFSFEGRFVALYPRRFGDPNGTTSQASYSTPICTSSAWQIFGSPHRCRAPWE